ncbi:hypothetical protein [Actinomadura hibisca]|uniref:hypothetical protein n=1 Tax=Actinomadura hibisca TaxID=68565 RepID=UPI0008340042|nr:hypothetical protein [Actinomadura hibisca]
MSTKLGRLAATSLAAVALATAGTTLTAPAASASPTWVEYSYYPTEASCKAKGAELRRNGTYLSYFCKYSYPQGHILMVLTR